MSRLCCAEFSAIAAKKTNWLSLLTMPKVLGIDLASSSWTAIGAATIEFEDTGQRFTGVTPTAIQWPSTLLTPAALADTIDSFAREQRITAVAMDGPQGWRDPETD